MKLLVFLTDAFGGRGGIAKFNRDLLCALCDNTMIGEVSALPRVVTESLGAMPQKLEFDTTSAGGLGRYLVRATRTLTSGRVQGVIVGHLNLLPLGAVAA